MSKSRWFVWRSLGVLTVIVLLAGLLTAGGLMLLRAGWSQGYAAGQLVTEGERGEVMPSAPPYVFPRFGYPGRFVGFSSCLVGIGLFCLLFFVIGKVFRLLFFGRMMAYGGWPMGMHWKAGRARQWYRRHGPWPHAHFHGPVPPWCWGWEDSPEGKAENTEPDGETGSAEA